MDAHPKMIDLLDTMINWPWPCAINLHFEDVKVEVDASFRKFEALNPEAQEAFDKCDFALLTILLYPDAPREHMQNGCDLMNVFFLLEEYADTENGSVTKELVDIALDVLHNPHKIQPEGESTFGEVMRHGIEDIMDMISYNKGQVAWNEDHNLISIVMLELSLDIDRLRQCDGLDSTLSR
ncbi:hypothetical protein EDB19DRAFT_1825953 [Suillus lakei]|nr:hypothetical protein EDB19DRAFT_1825953 [Suillus lakei]